MTLWKSRKKLFLRAGEGPFSSYLNTMQQLHGKDVLALAPSLNSTPHKTYACNKNGVKKYGANVEMVLNIARIPEHKVRRMPACM